MSRTSANGAFALYAISQAGLELLDVSGANGATTGGYTLHMFVAGDVERRRHGGRQSTASSWPVRWGLRPGQPGYLAGADANQDGVINATDEQLLRSDLGFLANPPPMSTAGQALTHQDLAVTVDLATLATDPEGDPIYFRVLNPQDGIGDALAGRPHGDVRARPPATPARPASSTWPTTAMGPRRRRPSRSTSAPRRWCRSTSRRGRLCCSSEATS